MIKKKSGDFPCYFLGEKLGLVLENIVDFFKAIRVIF
jgi:hypothetical protein